MSLDFLIKRQEDLGEDFNFKELSDFNSLSEIGDNSCLLNKDLLFSNLYIDSLLSEEGRRRPIGKLRNELIGRMEMNDEKDSDFNKRLLLKGGIGMVIGCSLLMGGVILKNTINKVETEKEVEKRGDLKKTRRKGLYQFGNNFKNSGKVINGVGKFFGKGLFKVVDLLDKVKL